MRSHTCPDKWLARLVLVVLLATLAPISLPRTVVAAPIFTVNSTLDEPDAAPGDGICFSTPSGKCTLRAAIMEPTT